MFDKDFETIYKTWFIANIFIGLITAIVKLPIEVMLSWRFVAMLLIGSVILGFVGAILFKVLK